MTYERTVTAIIRSETTLSDDDFESVLEDLSITEEELCAIIEQKWNEVIEETFDRPDSNVTAAVVAQVHHE